jgi:hypothetical protein
MASCDFSATSQDRALSQLHIKRRFSAAQSRMTFLRIVVLLYPFV